MKISEAINRVKVLKRSSVLIMVATSLLFTCSVLKSAYIALGNDSTPFAIIGQAVQRVIYDVYDNTQFISPVWQAAPIILLHEINSVGNLEVLLILLFGFIGKVMWDSAAHLSVRIAGVIKRVEEMGWERALMEGKNLPEGGKPDILQITINLEKKDKWYARPIGIILIGIITTVAAQWANLRFGLVH